MKYAHAVGHQAKDIDKKVCAKKKVNVVHPSGPDTETREAGRWSCVDYENAGTGSHYITGGKPADGKGFMWRFGNASKHLPGDAIMTQNGGGATTTVDGNYTARGWPGSAAGKYDTAEGMAKDLGALTKSEKGRVAGLLSKTISGAEVVEIRAVSTTSVMLNACYDLMSEGFSIVPYACLGVGANFVGIVDGHVTPKLA